MDKKRTASTFLELRRKSKLPSNHTTLQVISFHKENHLACSTTKEAQNKKIVKAPCNVRFKMRYNVSDFYYFTRGRYPPFKGG